MTAGLYAVVNIPTAECRLLQHLAAAFVDRGDGRRSRARHGILFMTGSLDVTPKTAEQNLIVYTIGRSVAEPTWNCIMLLKQTGHETSRGLCPGRHIISLELVENTLKRT